MTHKRLTDQLHRVLDRFDTLESENSALLQQVNQLRGKVRPLESLLDQKERRLLLLTELLDRRGDKPDLPPPEPELIEGAVA